MTNCTFQAYSIHAILYLLSRKTKRVAPFSEMKLLVYNTSIIFILNKMFSWINLLMDLVLPWICYFLYYKLGQKKRMFVNVFAEILLDEKRLLPWYNKNNYILKWWSTFNRFKNEERERERAKCPFERNELDNNEINLFVIDTWVEFQFEILYLDIFSVILTKWNCSSGSNKS